MPIPVTPPDLARTYNSQSYEDAWKAVEDYQRVLEYTGRHPNKGSSAVASALNLPRGRVHPWMNGSRPAPIRAIQIAEEHEWLPLNTDDALFPTFNRLVAWIFSRGSISEAEYAPMFSCDQESEQDRLAELFETIGVEYTIYREESTEKATEARISEHRTIIGRLLVLIGAPRGPRTDATTLPNYLTPPADTPTTDTTQDTTPTTKDTASAASVSTPPATDDTDNTQTPERTHPREHAWTFANTYLANTARYWPWKEGFVVRHEDRSPEYLHSLATVLEHAGESNSIEVNPDSLFLPTPLAEKLCPELTSGL